MGHGWEELERPLAGSARRCAFQLWLHRHTPTPGRSLFLALRTQFLSPLMLIHLTRNNPQPLLGIFSIFTFKSPQTHYSQPMSHASPLKASSRDVDPRVTPFLPRLSFPPTLCEGHGHFCCSKYLLLGLLLTCLLLAVAAICLGVLCEYG